MVEKYAKFQKYVRTINMYVCMYVCICTYVCTYVGTYAPIQFCYKMAMYIELAIGHFPNEIGHSKKVQDYIYDHIRMCPLVNM